VDLPDVQDGTVLGTDISARQRYVWALAGGPARYGSWSVFRVDGAVRAAALRAAVEACVLQHEIFRTTFTSQPGESLATPRLGRGGVRWGAPAGERTRGEPAHALLARLRAMPFDLVQGPLVSAIVEPFDGSMLLGLAAPAMCADARTLRLIACEALARCAGEAPSTPVFQYQRIASWQRGLLESPETHEGRDHWNSQGLNADTLRLFAASTGRSQARSCRRPYGLGPLVPDVATRLEVGEDVLLLACWYALIARVTADPEPPIGLRLDGRTVDELACAPGPLSRFIPTRAPADSSVPFGTFARQVQQRVDESVAYQHYFDPSAYGSRCLYPVCYSFEDRSWQHRVRSLVLTPLACETVDDDVDLELLVVRTPQGLAATCQVRDEDVTEAERLGEQFQAIVASALSNVHRRTDRLSAAGESERHALRVRATAAAHERPVEPRRVDELITVHARATPDRMAVRCADDCYTFAQLNDEADRLAAFLSRRGVGPEHRVGLLVDRSPLMLVALLGVLKSGGAYVPLDYSMGRSRLQAIAAGAGLDVVLTTDLAERRLQGPLGVDPDRIVRLDTGMWRAEVPCAAAWPQATAQNLAYILFTSGSTGTPKGVMISHAGLTHYVTWACEEYRIADGTLTPVHSSLGFDLTITSLLCPLVAGRAIVLLSDDDPIGGLVATLQGDAPVGLMKITPSHLRVLDHRLDPSAPVCAIGAIVVGGEELPGPLLASWRARSPRTRFINEYGPSETVVGCCIHEVGLDESLDGPLPIGRPIDRVRLCIVDPALELLPIRAVGELCVGGIGVARGYLNDPALTADRFVPDPFSGEPGARLYRTGDLARQRPDGTFEFVGRLDDQVKIRGFRIELGEIESALARHPGIKAVRVLTTTRIGHTQLVAYLTPHDTADLTAAALRSWLVTRLPDYMIPAAFVLLDELPLTINGKLDAARLPDPVSTWTNTRGRITPPRTETERLLAAIWADVLRLEQVSVHDSFFELGGDSITSIQVIARASQAGLVITPVQMFQQQTIAELSAAVDRAIVPPVASSEVPERAPLIPCQHWFFEEPPPDLRAWTQAVVLTLRKRVTATEIEHAVRAVCARHDVFRLRFVQTPHGREQRLGVPEEAARREPGSSVLFNVYDASRVEGVALDAMLTDAAVRLREQFCLETGPLAGAALLERAVDRTDRLLIVIHHLIVDAVSWRVLLSELEERLVAGQERLDASPAPASFLACAQRLHEHARSPQVAAELEYWVSDARSDIIALPPPGSGDPARNTGATVMLEGVPVSALDAAAHAFGATRYELLLTTLWCVFRSRYGVRALLVDVEGHGRAAMLHEIAGAPPVGAFTAIFPLVLASKGAELRDVTQAVQRELREVPGDGVGYGLLRYCATSRAAPLALQAMPRAEVLFNFLGSFDQVLARERSPFSQARVLTLPGEGLGRHRFTVGVQIVDGHVRISWTCRDRADAEGGPDVWALAYRDALQTVCASAPGAPAGDAVPDAGIEARYVTSPLQQGMLFHTLANRRSGVYFQQISCRLTPLADPSLLTRAWGIAVARHEALRSAFVSNRDGVAQQVVYRHVDLPVREEDWRELTREAQQARLESFLAADREAGFELERPPLLRLALFRVDAHEYLFTCSFHHGLLDGWSLHLVLRDVLTAYDALSRQRPLDLPPVVSLERYGVWLASRDDQRAEAFWRRTLQGYDAPVRVGATQSRADSPRDDREEACSVPPAMTKALVGMAQRTRLTIASILQGCWAIVLGAFSGEQDIVIGVTTSGRSAASFPGVESFVGLMMNTMPLRARVRPDASIAAWLQDLQVARSEALEFEHTPLSRIRAWSGVRAGDPLFESVVVCENYPAEAATAMSASTLRISDLRLRDSTSEPLTLVVRQGDTLSVRLLYDAVVVPPEMVRRMLAQTIRVLEAIAADPSRQIADLPLAEPDAIERIATQWRTPGPSSSDVRCLHEWFAQQVVRSPHAVAISCEGTHRTYEELDRRAMVVAARLQSYGVGPDVPVALLFEPSLDMIEAILGVLKAGGCYVPIEPRQPRARVDYILTDVKPPVIIAQPHLAAMAPRDRVVITMEDDEASDPRPLQAVASDPRHLAYIIYTSGSTGQPKGVQITHGAVSHLFQATADLFGLTDADVWTMFHSYAFDFAVWELWGALLFGGRAVIVPGWMTRSPEDFRQLILDERVTVLNQTPSALKQLLAVDRIPASEIHRAMASLRLVITGGEALDFPVLAPWLRRSAPRPRVVNMYGITETTVHVTHRDVSDGDLTDTRSLIGGGVPGLRVYVLDRQMRPSPTGVVGTMYVGGDQLARGYWGRPALTAERFVPDPFSPRPGARLYCSGDLARWHHDGELQYVGRADHQVKVHGFRIELGEVEAALRRVAGIRDAIVIQRTDAEAARLVAYVVADSPRGSEALRRALMDQLPEYMVPSVFVDLPALPMTANGKVDRHALPAPDLSRDDTTEYVAPRTAVEEILAAIWREVLRVSTVGVHDNFFALGGDSIIMLQVVALARQQGLSISPASVFTAPTIAELAAEAVHAEAAAAERPADDVGEAPLTPIQRWFFAQRLPNPHFWNQAILLGVRRALTRARLQAAVRALSRHHEALRHRFITDDGGRRSGFVSDDALSVIEIDLSRVAADSRPALMEACARQAHRRLDLTNGPLHRWLLFTSRPRSRASLFITIHHLIVDTVSWRILVEDLTTVCEQLDRREPVRLDSHSTSYDDWARALQKYAATFEDTPEARYWLDRHPIDVISMPSDAPLANRERTRCTERCRFSHARTASLIAALREFPGARVEDALLAVLAVAWRRWTGQHTLAIDVEHHGREHVIPGVDLTRTVGWFTSISPVTIAIPDTPLIRPMLEAVCQQMQAIPQHGFGYGLLRYLGRREAASVLAQQPRPEVALNYLGQLTGPARPSRFVLMEDLAAPTRDPDAVRAHLLEVSALIVRGHLRVHWMYSRNRHRSSSIQSLVRHFTQAMAQLLRECRLATP
jgi:amino acid adenylation domain-containing protein/non-ribosomal peptide synthase protein (TIGR01720 family)